MAEESRQSGSGSVSPRVNFDYIKAQHFRVIHVDGAVGGPTPNGHLLMSLFSERHAIPRRTVFAVENNALGQEIVPERVSRDAVVREVDVALMMTVETAESVAAWLDSKVKELRRLKAQTHGASGS